MRVNCLADVFTSTLKKGRLTNDYPSHNRGAPGAINEKKKKKEEGIDFKNRKSSGKTI